MIVLEIVASLVVLWAVLWLIGESGLA